MRSIICDAKEIDELLSTKSSSLYRGMNPGLPPRPRRIKASIECLLGRASDENPRGYSSIWGWRDVNGEIHSEWECPFGAPGARLWVREDWAPSIRDPESEMDHRTGQNCDAAYRVGSHSGDWTRYAPGADGELVASRVAPTWLPASRMPKWATRLQLELVDVDLIVARADSDAYRQVRRTQTEAKLLRDRMHVWMLDVRIAGTSEQRHAVG